MKPARLRKFGSDENGGTAVEFGLVAPVFALAVLIIGDGANLVLQGRVDLTGLQPATRLVFPSGAVLFVTEENRPCRHAGKMLADDFGEPRLELEFVRAAQGRRGLVAIVEREGEITAGDEVKPIAPKIAINDRIVTGLVMVSTKVEAKSPNRP